MLSFATANTDDECAWKDSTGECRTQAELDSIRKARDEWLWVDSCLVKDVWVLKTEVELDSLLKRHEIWAEIKRLKSIRIFGPMIKWLHILKRHEPRSEKLHLFQANLTDANLDSANLSAAVLCQVNLSNASLKSTNLLGAILFQASLSEANLNGAILSKALLKEANLSNDSLKEVDLYGAILHNANFSKATLWGANLSEASLKKADFQKANLSYANLSNADLSQAILSEVKMEGANLSGAIFEPIGLPGIGSIAYACNIERMLWKRSPAKLVELRNKLEESGFYRQARGITCAINSKDQSLLRYIAFDFTIEYGYNLLKPWTIMCWISGGMAIIYFLFFLFGRKSGVILIESPYDFGDEISLLYKNDGKKKFGKLNLSESNVYGKYKPLKTIYLVLRLPFWAIAFSAISTFSFGFRRFGFAQGLLRLAQRNIELEPYGLVRFFSGLQSLVSAYLILLWAANLFATPFR